MKLKNKFIILFFLIFLMPSVSAVSTLQIVDNTAVNMDNGAYLTLIAPMTFINTTDPVGRTYNASGNPPSTFELNWNTTRVRWHTATNKDLSLVSYNLSTDILTYNISGLSGYVNVTARMSNVSSFYSLDINGTFIEAKQSDGIGTVSFNYTGTAYSARIYKTISGNLTVSGYINNTLGAYVDGVRVELDHNYTFSQKTMIVNNTNLAPSFPGEEPGTNERVENMNYETGENEIQVLIWAHADTSGQTAEVRLLINGVKIQDTSGRPLGVAESSNKSIAVIIPRHSNYTLQFNNYHHYEWREYPIVDGYYEFTDLPAGNYNVLFQQVGYKNTTVPITLTSSNYTVNATLIPQFTPDEADFVLTTADLTYLALLLAIMDLSLLMKLRRKYK